MKISILTPSYNSRKCIERAIESVLDQDYNDWEHIIVDGGSTDGTIELLKKYPHLRWISEPDKGQSDAMNKAFEMSTGDLIGYLNADDYYEQSAFGHAVSCFQKNADCDFVLGDMQILHIENGVVVRSEWDNASTKYKEIVYPYRYRFPSNPVSYFYKRRVQSDYEGFALNNHYTMDYHFLLYAYQNYQIFKTDKLFGYFVMDGQNKTSKFVDIKKECIREAMRYVRKHDKIFFVPFLVHHYYYRYGRPKVKKWRYRLGVLRRQIL